MHLACPRSCVVSIYYSDAVKRHTMNATAQNPPFGLDGVTSGHIGLTVTLTYGMYTPSSMRHWVYSILDECEYRYHTSTPEPLHTASYMYVKLGRCRWIVLYDRARCNVL
jgi:hypothetical protein